MTEKEINDYYEGLEHNCINNYGGYTKEEIDDLYNRLNDDLDVDDCDPWEEFDYNNQYNSYPTDDYDGPY